MKLDVSFRDGYLRVNKVPTHIITFGGWVKDDNLEERKDKLIVLVIPGNPGMIEFYRDFMETIYTRLGSNILVWGISHAGHVKVPDGINMPSLHGNEDLYGLHGQIEHKLVFIENYIPPSYSVILIGHSIGCYISLKIMSSSVGNQVLKSILLFPTIENLALSPQGRWATPLLNYFQPVAVAILFIMSYLSTRIQYKILEWFFQGQKVAPCALRASLNVFDCSCTRKWMFMAKQEMVLVREADVESIAYHLRDLFFYYGANDHWCPLSYYEKLREKFPTGNIHLCDKGYDHAFVLKTSNEVGTMVASWLQDMINEYRDMVILDEID